MSKTVAGNQKIGEVEMKIFIAGLYIGVGQLAGAQSVDDRSLEELKDRIEAVAAENTLRLDNLTEIRKQLDPLVKELQEKGDQSKEERISGKVGTWQQLWTDDSDDTRPNNFFSTIDRSRTFQVVDESGFFYNVSELNTAVGLKSTVFLRGVYTPSGDGIAIKFTNLDIKALGTKDITGTTYLLEDGKEKFFSATRFARFPRGPVGAEGYIDTVYVDEDLRVDYGYNTADEIVDLFVLKRIRN